MKKYSFIIFAAMFLSLFPIANGETPMEKIKGSTEKVVKLLKDPALEGDAKKNERQQLVRDAMEKCFAWEDSARACLGHHWTKRTPEEKAEFTKLFSNFLKETYSDKIVTYFNDLDKIDYQGEKILEGDYASVKLVISTKAKNEHPLEYRLEKTDANGWMIYDVVIEGVSLVKNYRDQFDAIIAKSSYEGLINEIKSKKPSAP